MGVHHQVGRPVYIFRRAYCSFNRKKFVLSAVYPAYPAQQRPVGRGKAQAGPDGETVIPRRKGREEPSYRLYVPSTEFSGNERRFQPVAFQNGPRGYMIQPQSPVQSDHSAVFLRVDSGRKHHNAFHLRVLPGDFLHDDPAERHPGQNIGGLERQSIHHPGAILRECLPFQGLFPFEIAYGIVLGKTYFPENGPGAAYPAKQIYGVQWFLLRFAIVQKYAKIPTFVIGLPLL